MPNSNVVDRITGAATGGDQQGTKVAPAITLTTTTEKQFTDQTGAVATVYFMPQAAIAANGPFDGFSFKVRATFKVTTGGSSTNIISIYLGNSTTINSNAKIATITSDSKSTASTSGVLEALLIWDNTSQLLNGVQTGAYGTTAVSATALTNTNNSATTVGALKFSITSTNGSSVSGTVVQLGEFVVEAV